MKTLIDDLADLIAVGLTFIALSLGMAVDAKAQELTFNTSGFASYTYLSESSFHDNSGLIAENFAVFYGDFALKGQVSNNEYEPIRRLAVEYATGVPGDNLTFQLGRIPRLNTLFSDVYGNPDEWGMAVLPLSTYNRRKVHSLAFNALEGGKLIWDHNRDWGGIRTTINYGKTIEEYTCEYQMEATRKPCQAGWDFQPTNGNYDLSFEARIGTQWTLLASYNKLILQNTLLDPTNRRAVMTVNALRDLDYRFGRLGIKYDADWGYVQTEHGESRLLFNTPKGWKLDSTAWDDYLLGGFYVTDQLTAFAGYSRGHSRASKFTSRDRFIGAVWRDDRWAYSLERHLGAGAWQRHGSDDSDWRTLVVSVTASW